MLSVGNYDRIFIDSFNSNMIARQTVIDKCFVPGDQDIAAMQCDDLCMFGSLVVPVLLIALTGNIFPGSSILVDL
jgi:hypothetical protein